MECLLCNCGNWNCDENLPPQHTTNPKLSKGGKNPPILKPPLITIGGFQNIFYSAFSSGFSTSF